MKIYKHEPSVLIRLQIAKQGEQAEYLTLTETTSKEVDEFIRKIIEAQKISPFAVGRVTSINIREAIGAKNGKAKSISFRGLTPKETLDLILKELGNDV